MTSPSTTSLLVVLLLALFSCASLTHAATSSSTTSTTSTQSQSQDPLSAENVVTFASSLQAYGEQLSNTAQMIMLQLSEHLEVTAETEVEAEVAEHERAWHKHNSAGMFPLPGFSSRASAELSDELSKDNEHIQHEHENLLRDEDGVPHLDNGAIDTHALLAELHQTQQHIHQHAHAQTTSPPNPIDSPNGILPLPQLTEAEKAHPKLAPLLAKEAVIRSKLLRAHNLVETKKGAAFMDSDKWQDKLNRQKRIDHAKERLLDPHAPLDEELLSKEIEKRRLVLDWKNKGIPFDNLPEIERHINEARRLRQGAPPVMQPPVDGDDPALAGNGEDDNGAAASASEVTGSGTVQAPVSNNGNERNLVIPVNTNMSPEAIKDLENSLQNHGADPYATIPGRAEKSVAPKEWTVTDLMDPLRERCPNRCNGKGLCVMNLKETVTSTGGMNVHPYMCLCDAGYVGDACQIKLDMYLRYLLSEGAAPYPKCCKVCPSQLKAPMKFHDIPTFINPFSKIAEGCRPLPYISSDSREAQSIRLRRHANDKCVQPLSTFEPVVALELATTLSHAQHIMASTELAEALATPSANRTSEHVNSLTKFAERLARAGESAEQAASRLIKRFASGTNLSPKDPAARLNTGLIHDELRRLPPVSECCLFCDLTEAQKQPGADEPVLDAKQNPNLRPRVYSGPDSILNSPAQHDSVQEEVLRNWAVSRRERRHAKLLGLSNPDDRPCCVVCPFNFREGFAAQDLQDYKEKNGQNAVFLEVDASAGMGAGMAAEMFATRRTNQVLPCCNACPSQFLASHAFPAGPFDGERQPPVPSKASDKPAQGGNGGAAANAPPASDQPIPTSPVVEPAVAQAAKGFF